MFKSPTVEQVVRLRKKGMTVKAIAARFGVVQSTIARRLSEAGMVRRPVQVTRARLERLLARHTHREIANILGVGMGKVSSLVGQYGLFRRPPSLCRDRSDVTPEAVKRGRAAGKTLTQIAREFGCSVGLVHKRLHSDG
jgi:transposase-like protein